MTKNMEKPIIEIKNISKEYSIFHQKGSYVALRDVIANIIKSPFSHFKSKVRELTGRETKENFSALSDVSFNVGKGEVVGIIGANGAGKSTLLKILTGITPPTKGEIIIRGKVASLLEVGTGFHPELTGRENIFLNGAILGMTRKEIIEKFDEIVQFSGIEQFLDTPVKRYSSGMYVRLAFSVAAHMEPDILLVDEVLAVGDAEFQKKCLGKMDEVTKKAGRTILFVSHNMDAISRLCKKTVLLCKGKIAAIGETEKIVNMYMDASRGEKEKDLPFPIKDKEISVNGFSIIQNSKEEKNIYGGNHFSVKIDFSSENELRSFRAGIFIKNAMGVLVSRSFIQDWSPEFEKLEAGRYETEIIIPGKIMLEGEYQIELKLFCFGIKDFFENKTIEKTVRISPAKDYNRLRSRTGNIGYFLVPSAWKVEKN
jgi:lipopolysaccharide transport system ATP-binding protein